MREAAYPGTVTRRIHDNLDRLGPRRVAEGQIGSHLRIGAIFKRDGKVTIGYRIFCCDM